MCRSPCRSANRWCRMADLKPETLPTGRWWATSPPAESVYNGVENASFVTTAGGSVMCIPARTAQPGRIRKLATLSQSVATMPGQSYLLSFWLINPTSTDHTNFRCELEHEWRVPSARFTASPIRRPFLDQPCLCRQRHEHQFHSAICRGKRSGLFRTGRCEPHTHSQAVVCRLARPPTIWP